MNLYIKNLLFPYTELVRNHNVTPLLPFSTRLLSLGSYYVQLFLLELIKYKVNDRPFTNNALKQKINKPL